MDNAHWADGYTDTERYVCLRRRRRGRREERTEDENGKPVSPSRGEQHRRASRPNPPGELGDNNRCCAWWRVPRKNAGRANTTKNPKDTRRPRCAPTTRARYVRPDGREFGNH